MKLKAVTALLSGVFMVGCSTTGVIPMGKDTYMVHRGGWPAMNGFEVEADCLKAANSFCEKRGLEMVPIKTETIDGKVFVHNASSKLVFKATAPNSVPSNPPR